MKNIFTSIFFAGFLTATVGTSSGAKADDCTALFDDLYNYSTVGVIGNCEPNFNAVKIKMSTNRNDNRYVSYASGWLFKPNLRPCIGPRCLIPVENLSGDSIQEFSDRIGTVYSASCNNNCFGVSQDFTQSAQDKLNIAVSASSATIMLKSWGNAKSTFPVSCSNGMMYGIQSGTFYVFSFQKVIYTNNCIR